MPNALAHGDVVASGRAMGVVWSVGDGELTVLPIGRASSPPRRHEIPIDQSAGILLVGLPPDAVIHADMEQAAPIAGQRKVGRIASTTVCRCSQARARAYVERHTEARWAGERESRMGRLEDLRSAV